MIKWEGYDSNENTWEYADNMNCPDLIKEFEESHPNEAKKKKRKESKELEESIGDLKKDVGVTKEKLKQSEQLVVQDFINYQILKLLLESKNLLSKK